MEMAPAFQVTEVKRTEMLDPELVYVDVNRCASSIIKDTRNYNRQTRQTNRQYNLIVDSTLLSKENPFIKIHTISE